MRSFVQYLRDKLGYRTLPYVDDFLVAPSPFGTVATREHVSAAKSAFARLMRRLGLRRNPEKGCWEVAQVIEHLGMVINTRNMKIFAQYRKIKRVREMS